MNLFEPKFQGHAQKQYLKRIKKMLQRRADLQLIFHIQNQRGKHKEGYIKPIGSSTLKRQEKAKWGNLWDWIKSKMEKHISFTLVGTGQLTFTVNRV